jgi:hypothetical protein
VLGDGEPETRAAEALGGRGIRLAERLEQPAELFTLFRFLSSAQQLG